MNECYFCSRVQSIKDGSIGCSYCSSDSLFVRTAFYDGNSSQIMKAMIDFRRNCQRYYIDLLLEKNCTEISYWSDGDENILAHIDGFPINPGNAREFLNRILKLKAFQ